MSDEETIVTPTELMTGVPEYDIGEFMNIMNGYNVSKAKEFEDKLRKLLDKVGLIHIAEKRWAGQEFDPEIHDDSDTIADRFVGILVSEYIQLLKDENQEKLDEDKYNLAMKQFRWFVKRRKTKK
tara:strand:- start:787 stop:1161 length:375 start_codon:yes stop_codon:yes gene_type:complete